MVYAARLPLQCAQEGGPHAGRGRTRRLRSRRNREPRDYGSQKRTAMLPLASFVSLLFVYALLSRRAAQTPITAPIIFTAAGMVMSPVWTHVAEAGVTANVFLRLAELGLVLLLFTDASRTDLTVLRRIGTLPGRLLSTGLLLTILLGGIVARLVFPGLSIWEAGILAAILAPTDAGLGQIVVR